jgi:prepilin-type N-terminal cleavage/methylation domain-containing protein
MIHSRRTIRSAIHLRSLIAPAFTLIELLVTLAIISVLASLTLAGLSVARTSAKRSATETTIRKINEVILGQYESYLSSRATLAAGSVEDFDGDSLSQSKARLIARRRLVALEMPERWTDIACTSKPTPDPLSHSVELTTATDPPKSCALDGLSPIAQRFQNIMTGFNMPDLILNDKNELAECLFLNVMLSGYGDPDLIMHFRDNEMGDTNRNGLREFLDGWGNPIQFLRWAPGFVSAYQPAPFSTRASDPFDNEFVDKESFPTLAGIQIARRMVPVIISGGVDAQLGIKTQPATGAIWYSRHSFDPFYRGRAAGTPYLGIGPLNTGNNDGEPVDPPGYFVGALTSDDAREAADNIHSHAMSR